MNHCRLVVLTLTIISCQNQTQNTISKEDKSDVASSVVQQETAQQSGSSNKIPIRYQDNKDLLDIILLLPDSAFQSWEWKLEDRMAWYNEIKNNDYYLDDDPNFFNLKYFEPHQAGFSIADGFWSINAYKCPDNSIIIITDDRVGDGHAFCFYEVRSMRLRHYGDEKSVFSDFRNQLKKRGNTENCTEVNEEINDPIFDYHFLDSNKIEIESSGYLSKESHGNCLIGNAIRYNFNPETKKFELEEIGWKLNETD